MKPLPVLLATFCMILIAPAHAQAPRRVFRLETNAGTGPYDITSVFGTTQYGNEGIRRRLHFDRCIIDFRQDLINADQADNATDVEEFEADAKRQFDQISQLIENDRSLLSDSDMKNYYLPIRRALSSGRSFKRQPIEDDANNLANSVFKGLREAFDAETARAEHYILHALKLGSYWNPSGAFTFESLSSSGPDRLGKGQKKVYSTSYVAESAIVPTNQPLLPASARFQGGYAFGDPDHWVSAVSIATFLSPYALDAEANLSLRLEAAPTDDPAIPETMFLDNFEADASKTARQRGLLDHLRPGDLWAFGSVRSVWVPGSSPYLGGNMLEAALTYGLRNRRLLKNADQNPIAATTLSISGIYCAQRVLNVNELGFEARAPIGPKVWDTPVFISGRYGTRGNFTVSLESKF